jgi:hypothetical protein
LPKFPIDFEKKDGRDAGKDIALEWADWKSWSQRYCSWRTWWWWWIVVNSCGYCWIIHWTRSLLFK